MKRYRVEVVQTAQAEAVDAVLFFSQESSVAADRWLTELEERLRRLETHPRMGRYAPERAALQGVELRQIIHKSHRALYWIQGETVWVLGVRHGARRPMSARVLKGRVRQIRNHR